MYVYHVPGTHKDQKWILDRLKLELPVVVVWELDSGCLHEQQVLLTTKPSLQPLPFSFTQNSRTDWFVWYNSECNCASGGTVWNLLHSCVKKRNRGVNILIASLRHWNKHYYWQSWVTAKYLCRPLHTVHLLEGLWNSSSVRAGWESCLLTHYRIFLNTSSRDLHCSESQWKLFPITIWISRLPISRINLIYFKQNVTLPLAFFSFFLIY